MALRINNVILVEDFTHPNSMYSGYGTSINDVRFFEAFLSDFASLFKLDFKFSFISKESTILGMEVMEVT